MGDIATKYSTVGLNDQSVVIDGGAYRGDWTQYIASVLGCRVFAFEPFLESFDYVLQRFQGAPNITIYPFALSDRDGCTSLYLTENKDGNSLYDRSQERRVVGSIIVPTVRLDTFLRVQEIAVVDLIKLNVEGAENEILQSIDKVLAPRIKRICFSSHVGKITRQEQHEKTIKHLQAVGYRVSDYCPEDWVKEHKTFGRYLCEFGV